MTPSPHSVVIEAALNGSRGRDEHLAVPFTAPELAAEARRCADEGATVFHVHARDDNGGWTVDAGRYREIVRALRDAVPAGLVSITSLRPESEPVTSLVALLGALAADPATPPDLISINLGHITVWEPLSGATDRRRTVLFPNTYADITRLLAACQEYTIRPELGIMDLGFVSNAVALRDDGVLPARPWFLIELDSPAYGSGAQVAPATVANYE
ncbi:MAG: 3-keto-5-aminohexanoate cleavage protein, partial [Chloroflexia bacterium]|nr:3-keto-5-aminohexanoate cleavage protein [Chloroflexia bacterium]